MGQGKMKELGFGALLAVVALVAGGAGYLTNGLSGVTVGGSYSHLDMSGTVPVDTGLPNGINPQSIGTHVFRLNGSATSLISNTASATAGAATLNRISGTVTTEALTTAAGGTYTLTLANSVATPGATVYVEVDDGTNTSVRPRSIQVTSVTVTSGQIVVVLTNQGTVALNGTLLVAFLLP